MKKFISILLLLTMMLSLFAGCAKEEPKADTAGLEAAKKYVQTSYINDEATTPMDYKMPGVAIVSVEGEKKQFNVDWSTNSDKITCTRGDDNFVTIKVPMDNLEDIKYTLTATISDGNGNKQTVSFERMVPARAGIPTNVADGTYVIVYDNLTFSALAEDKGYGYAPATQVTVADGAVTGHTAADVITIKNVDGGFTMQDAYGRYIYLKGTYNSFNVGTELNEETMAVWQLLTGKEGKQFIINAGTMKTLAYDTSYSSWGAYPEISGTRMSTVSVIAVTAPESGDPGTEDPGTEDPGTEDPGTEDPGTENPGTENPADKPSVPSGSDAKLSNGTYIIADNKGNTVIAGKCPAADKSYGYLYDDYTADEKHVTTVYTIKSVGGGKYTIQDCDNRYLGVSGTYASFQLYTKNEGNNCLWTISNGKNGEYIVKNVENGRCIDYSAEYSSFGVYEDGKAPEDGQIKLIAGKAAEKPAEKPEEKPQDKPTTPSGDTVSVKDGNYVIVVTGYNKALSSTYTGFYNLGVDVTVSGNTVSGHGATEIWTITNNGDGTFSISINGQKLSMDTQYSSMPMDKANDKWVAVDAGNGLVYIKNVGRESYIEWYADKSNFSSYHTIAEGKEALFAIKLIAV